MDTAWKIICLLIIFTLAMPVMVSAADMQNCPHMEQSMNTDMLCHDMGVNTDSNMSDMDCGDDCNSNCTNFYSSTMLFNSYNSSFYNDVVTTYTHFLKPLKSFIPNTITPPPISIS